VLIDRRAIRSISFSLALALLVALAAWYAAAYAFSEPWRLPGGSSPVGLTIGIVAGLIFLFEFLYWPKRSAIARTWRWAGRAESWLRAHIWLGLITLPLVLLHSGFSLGGWFTTVFTLVFFAVWGSGVFGLVMQQIIPRWLLDEAPEETIHSQIDAVMAQHLQDAERLVARATGDLGVFASEPEASALGVAVAEQELVRVGSARRVGTQRERLRYRDDAIEAIPHTEALRDALKQDIRPFLGGPASRRLRIGTPGKANEYFAELRRRVPEAAHGVVGQLEGICSKHRQLRFQKRLYWWLHAWLTVHLPLSVALMILLVLHVVTALQYGGVPGMIK
jgi:hypothetical protein